MSNETAAGKCNPFQSLYPHLPNIKVIMPTHLNLCPDRDITPESDNAATRNKKRKRADSTSEEMKVIGDSLEEQCQDKRPSKVNRFLPREKIFLSENICLCQPDPKIPRPRNAFILFRQHHQSRIVARHPGLSNPEISKLLGEEWKNSPAEVKNEWKRHAEAEKERHMQQHPGYKYQPRRYSQRRSEIELGGEHGASNCEKCGGRLNHIRGNPMSLDVETQGLSPSHNAVHNPSKKHQIQPYSDSRSSSPLKRQGIHSSWPSSIAIAPLSQPRAGLEQHLKGPTTRRDTNGPLHPSSLLPTPYRRSFAGRFGPDQARKWGPLSAGVNEPASNLRPSMGNPDLDLAPSTTFPEPPNIEQYIASIPFLLKVYQLARIAPPFKSLSSTTEGAGTRGAIIAVEGDDQAVVGEMVKWLEKHLGTLGEYFVKTAKGPIGPRVDEVASIADYMRVIADWQTKSNDMIAFITGEISEGVPSSDDEVAPDAFEPSSLIPVVILQRFQLFAANTYAANIPIRDAYKPLEHWQWVASLWRGTIGPDITICIKDVRSEDVHKDSRLVEVQDELGVVVVKRERRSGHETSSQTWLDESTLRRLGFEIGELLRSIATSHRG